MFATPTIYMPSRSAAGPMPGWLACSLNPMTGLIAASGPPAWAAPIPWASLAVSASASVLLFLVGCLYFRKVEDRFADII